ncbi:hypothetical protein GALL_171470 [mine drainage metagenome]|uniref:Uncharacterized protein n=1 Tax=mine drainage metagenome TaxID=410659 RepID=A0A1J5RY99_9ZZZZ
MGTVITFNGHPPKTAAGAESRSGSADQEALPGLERRYNLVLNMLPELTSLEITLHRGGWPEAAAFVGAARCCLVDSLEEIVEKAKR